MVFKNNLKFNMGANKRSETKQAMIASVLRDSIANLFVRNELITLGLNSQMISVTNVLISKDLKTAKIYISILNYDTKKDEEEAVIGLLNKSSNLIRTKLTQKKCLKFVPLISFTIDKSLARINHIETILDQVKL